MSQPVIQVRELGKRYRLGALRSLDRTLPEAIIHTAKRLCGAARRPVEEQPPRDFWALRNVSFDIHRGDVVGIIGANGAGKSTLLKILSQITDPTEGSALMRGRVASLLEVGTGFHPELTGRENICLNGSILGMTRREIAGKFDSIVEFSGVSKFLDTPVKHYSSGMSVRLAFAIAAHLDPEVLIVDEVLAVGDAEFQAKCLGKMRQVAQGEGRTVLFVSHHMGMVRSLCTRGIFLKGGQVAYSGSAGDAIDRYLELHSQRNSSIVSHLSQCDPSLRLLEATVNGTSMDEVTLRPDCRRIDITLRGEAREPVQLGIEAQIIDGNQVPLGYFSPRHARGWRPAQVHGPFELRASVALPRLARGQYYLTLYVTNPFVRGYATLPQAVRLCAEGAASETGVIFDYARGTGWAVLVDPNADGMPHVTDHQGAMLCKSA